MRITKIKLPKDKIALSYEIENLNGDFDEYSMSCSDKARPEFYEAMENLVPHVLEMCELPETYVNRINVKGVSFSYSAADIMGATISAEMVLERSNCNLNINTPHKTREAHGEHMDSKALLSGECVEALDELAEECIRYISGDRAQVLLIKAS